MILLTGASGTVGRALLPLLLEAGQDVRALVRDPRGLGRHRVDVQIALGDLARLGDRHLQRQALRGVDTVIHLAAAIRDEPHARVEELNGLGDGAAAAGRRARRRRALRLLLRARRHRFPADALLPRQGAGRARGRRLPARDARSSRRRSSTTRGDRWVRAHEAPRAASRSCRSRAPGAPPTSRSGRPTWRAASSRPSSVAKTAPATSWPGPRSSPTTRSRAPWRARPGASGRVVHVPLSLVHLTLVALRRVFGEAGLRHLGRGGADGGADDHPAGDG